MLKGTAQTVEVKTLTIAVLLALLLIFNHIKYHLIFLGAARKFLLNNSHII